MVLDQRFLPCRQDNSGRMDNFVCKAVELNKVFSALVSIVVSLSDLDQR